jgi:hypothetical protein
MVTEMNRLQHQLDTELQRRKQAEEEAAQIKREAAQTKLELDQMAADKADLVGLAPDAASLQVRLQAQQQLVDYERAQEHEAEQELQGEVLGQGSYGGGGNNDGMNGGGNVTFDAEGRLGCLELPLGRGRRQ